MRKPNYRFERAERDRAKKAKKRQEAAAATGKGGDPRRRRHARTDRGERAARNLIDARLYRIFQTRDRTGPLVLDHQGLSAENNAGLSISLT